MQIKWICNGKIASVWDLVPLEHLKFLLSFILLHRIQNQSFREFAIKVWPWCLASNKQWSQGNLFLLIRLVVWYLEHFCFPYHMSYRTNYTNIEYLILYRIPSKIVWRNWLGGPITVLLWMTSPGTQCTFQGGKKQGRWISKAMLWSSDRAKRGPLPGNNPEASGGGKDFPMGQG